MMITIQDPATGESVGTLDTTTATRYREIFNPATQCGLVSGLAKGYEELFHTADDLWVLHHFEERGETYAHLDPEIARAWLLYNGDAAIVENLEWV